MTQIQAKKTLSQWESIRRKMEKLKKKAEYLEIKKEVDKLEREEKKLRGELVEFVTKNKDKMERDGANKVYTLQLGLKLLVASWVYRGPISETWVKKLEAGRVN